MGPFTFVRFIFFVACLFACTCMVSAQETYSDEELDALSDADLEQICLIRGFELVKDHLNEETGEVYTIQHVDYVAAAKQCLSIEIEMNEILEEHPELREELEEEIIKMQQEQEARKEELENLQQQVQDDDPDAPHSASEGAAFVGKPKMKEAQDVTADEPAVSDAEEQQTIKTEPLEEEVEKDASNTDAEEQLDSEEKTDESGTQPTTDKTEGLEISDEERIPLNEEEEAALADQEKLPDDVTLEYLRDEFIKYVKKDIERVTRILIPILKPMLNAGDLAIRYIRAALTTLRDGYNNSQANPTEETAEAR